MSIKYLFPIEERQHKSTAIIQRENVNIRAKAIPTAIIFPNSITGFKSPNVKDKKAIAVVNAANRQGIKILLNALCNDAFLSEVSISVYLTMT